MKIRVSMKDPDALDTAVESAVAKELTALGLPADEKDAIREIRFEKAKEAASKWFTYGEYLDVEIDTEADTCVVVPRKP